MFAGLEPLLYVGVTRHISAAPKRRPLDLGGGVGVVEIEPDLRGRSPPGRLGRNVVGWAGQLEIGRVSTGSPAAKRRPLQTSAVASALWRSMMPRRTALRTA